MLENRSRGTTFRPIIKTISLIVVLCFFVQDIAWALNGIPLWSVIKGNRVLTAQAKDFTNLSKITIPEDYGIIKEVYNAGSDKIIINIQDAHSSLGAQESINKVIEGLVNTYGLKLVALEGARGHVDTSFLQSYPDEKKRKELADYFLKKGKINAAEYYKASSNSDVKLYGVEDASLYRENVASYIESLKNKGKIHRAVIMFKKAISDLKARTYSKALRELDQKRQQYRLQNISFKEYWEYLGRVSRKLNIDISEFKNVEALLEASRFEERTDFQKAQKEREALIELLSKSLAKDDLQELLEKSFSFRLGKIQSSLYHNRLREFALSCGIDISLYPNLSGYTDYINMHDKVLIDDLFNELNDIIYKIQGKLFRNGEERVLANASRKADILIDLLDAKIVNRDLAYYKAHRKEFIPQNIAQELSPLMVKHNVLTNLVPDMRAIAEALPVVERFYEIAGSRDAAMIRNTIAKMEQDKRSLAVLVTGGFHTEGITRLLKEQNISYMVVLPKFSKDALDRPYEDVILNKKEPFEDVLSQGEYYLAAASLFSNLNVPDESRIALATMFICTVDQEKTDTWVDRWFGLIRAFSLNGESALSYVSPDTLRNLIGSADFKAYKGATLVRLGKDVFKVTMEDGQLRPSLASAEEIAQMEPQPAAPADAALAKETRTQDEVTVALAKWKQDLLADGRLEAVLKQKNEANREQIFRRRCNELLAAAADEGVFGEKYARAKEIYEGDPVRVVKLRELNRFAREWAGLSDDGKRDRIAVLLSTTLGHYSGTPLQNLSLIEFIKEEMSEPAKYQGFLDTITKGLRQLDADLEKLSRPTPPTLAMLFGEGQSPRFYLRGAGIFDKENESYVPEEVFFVDLPEADRALWQEVQNMHLGIVEGLGQTRAELLRAEVVSIVEFVETGVSLDNPLSISMLDATGEGFVEKVQAVKMALIKNDPSLLPEFGVGEEEEADLAEPETIAVDATKASGAGATEADIAAAVQLVTEHGLLTTLDEIAERYTDESNTHHPINLMSLYVELGPDATMAENPELFVELRDNIAPIREALIERMDSTLSALSEDQAPLVLLNTIFEAVVRVIAIERIEPALQDHATQIGGEWTPLSIMEW